MRNVLLRCSFLVILAAFLLSEADGQGLHFSQFQNSPLNHNPGLTGVFSGDQRFIGTFRRQWFQVPVDYLTFSGSYDMKFRRDGARSFWGAGAIFNYDRAGDARMAMAYIALNGSYTFGVTPGFLITLGVQAGGGQRSLRTNELTWGNYWDGSGIDPSRPSGEPNGLGDSRYYFDLGAGLNFRLQKSKRTFINIGIGGLHLNEPNNTFYDEGDAKLPIRTAIMVNGSLQVASFMDVQANGLLHYSGPFQEIVLGGLVNFHLSQKKAREMQFGVGAAVRLDDAIIPMVQIAYDGWLAGFSYDINTSLFDGATSGRGGPEVSLIYIITKVRPLDESKLCRIF